MLQTNFPQYLERYYKRGFKNVEKWGTLCWHLGDFIIENQINTREISRSRAFVTKIF